MVEKLAKILVVDDEIQIRRLLRVSLTAHHYDVLEAVSGAEASEALASENPDLMILDLGLPDEDGFAVIRKLREWSKLPVIVLSVRSQEKDKILALDLGANDYVDKPFNMGELLARIRAVLRQKIQSEGVDPVFQCGELRIDFVKRLVVLEAQEIKLTPKEYELLRVLAVKAGRVLTHQQLLREVWGEEFRDDTQYLRVYVRQLRQKIEKNPAVPFYILTEPGVGYRMRAAIP
jgi:two-component system KDP operon response regulator KdpE